MPRSGGWLNSVKVLLGFFELAFSLKFLSMADLAYGWHIMDREVFLVIWIVIFMLAGLYLLGKIKFAGDDDVEVVSVPRFFFSTFCFSMCIYMLPGLWGAPLKAVSAFVPPLSTQDFNLYNDKVSATFKDYDDALMYAELKNMPVVVDFTGHACVNCRKMESSVWSQPRVKSLLTDDYILVSLYVDDRTELPRVEKVIENGKEIKLTTVGEKWSYLQRSKFGANAQPYYCLLDPNGKPINHPMGFTEKSDEFIDFLRTGLKNFKKIIKENEK
jgi:thiol:disulfide interchange protein DsbD